jgi:predicted RNA methylase
MKAGFFACPPEAIADALQYLRPCDTNAAMLDPCAGEGVACEQLASALGMQHDHVFCVELDGGRGAKVRDLMPAATVLSPCAFEHTRISNGSFGLLFQNPPFDEQIGGGRAEMAFLQRAPWLLVPGGILLFVCPEHVANRYDFRKLWAEWFDDVACWRFPETCRKFGEVFVIGQRKAEQDKDVYPDYFECRRPTRQYVIPAAPGPKVFEKTAMTDEELAVAVDGSPLYRFLAPQAASGLARPPLALSVGHLALLLSSGQLDGLVRCPDGTAHVVRGTARKREELTEETTEEDKNGSKTTKVFTERIHLVVRAVDSEGVIHNLE